MQKFSQRLSEKMGGKIVQCILYSVQCTVYSECVQRTEYSVQCTLKFIEGAPVFLSLGSETFCQAPAVPHPSR